MQGLHPTVEELLAYLEGTASPANNRHIASCNVCRDRVTSYRQTEATLRGRLARFTCPSPHELGEYELGLLDPAETTRVAAHIVDCPRCTEEMQQLRVFLATDLPVPAPTVGERFRRFVATLVPAPMTPAVGLRGAIDDQIRTYQAGDLRLTLDLLPIPGSPAVELVGLLWSEGPTEVPMDVSVTLRHAEQVVQQTTVDPFGNFGFTEIVPNSYQLTLTVGPDLIVIEDLQIG